MNKLIIVILLCTTVTADAVSDWYSAAPASAQVHWRWERSYYDCLLQLVDDGNEDYSDIFATVNYRGNPDNAPQRKGIEYQESLYNSEYTYQPYKLVSCGIIVSITDVRVVR